MKLDVDKIDNKREINKLLKSDIIFCREKPIE